MNDQTAVQFVQIVLREPQRWGHLEATEELAVYLKRWRMKAFVSGSDGAPLEWQEHETVSQGALH